MLFAGSSLSTSLIDRYGGHLVSLACMPLIARIVIQRHNEIRDCIIMSYDSIGGVETSH